MQLERLNAEQAARTKRERRRANEIKTRTIQRMQLQMTAPLDIGLEQADASLALGQEDTFDLGDAEVGLRKRGGQRLTRSGADMDSDNEDDEEEDGDEDEDLDDDEDGEKTLGILEDELDGLYENYQDRLRDRDAKFRVKEARLKNAEREEWGGVKEDGSDMDSDDEEGGYEKMEEAKGESGDSSSDDSDEEEDEQPSTSKKRSRKPEAPVDPKRRRLLTKLDNLDAKPSTSQASKVWFSQDIFAGMGNIDDISEDEQPDEEADEMEVDEEEAEADEAKWEDAVSLPPGYKAYKN